MYSCVSFVYLSLLSLSVLLFKIFYFRFHVFLTGLFPHAFLRLSLFGTTLVRDRFDSRVYICRIFLFFSFQVIQQLRYVFPGLLFAEIFSWLVEIDHEIFSTVILSLPLIQEGQLSVSGERMCTILVNRLED